MRAYVAATGTLFTLLVVAHVWRVIAEPHLLGDVWYWLITAAAFALAIWAWRLLLRRARA